MSSIHEPSKAAFEGFFRHGSDSRDQDLLREPNCENMVEFMKRGTSAEDLVNRAGALRYLALRCAKHSVFNPLHRALMERLAPWLFRRSTRDPNRTHWDVACDEGVTLDNYHMFFPGAYTHPAEWARGELIPVPHVEGGRALRGAWSFKSNLVTMQVPGVARPMTVSYNIHQMMATLNCGPPPAVYYHASHMFNGVVGSDRDCNPLNIRWEMPGYNAVRVDHVRLFNEGLGEEAPTGAALAAPAVWDKASGLQQGEPGGDASTDAVFARLCRIAEPITDRSKELIYCVTAGEAALHAARRGPGGEALPQLPPQCPPAYATRFIGPHLYSRDAAELFDKTWAMKQGAVGRFKAALLGMATACVPGCAPGGGVPIRVTTEGELVLPGGVGGGETWIPAAGGGDAGASGSGGGGGLAGPSTMAAGGQAAGAAGGGVAPPARAGGVGPGPAAAQGGQGGGGGGGGAQAGAQGMGQAAGGGAGAGAAAQEHPARREPVVQAMMQAAFDRFVRSPTKR